MQVKWLALLSAVALLAAVFGCGKKEGGPIIDAHTATERSKEAETLTEPAFAAISAGAKPSETELNNMRKALTIYEELAKFSPSTSSPYFLMGRIRVALDDNAKAEENFRQFFAAVDSPDDLRGQKPEEVEQRKADAHFLLGTVLVKMKRADEALVEADQALKIRPDTLTFLIFRATCLAELGKKDEAKQQLFKTLQKYPTSTVAKALMKELNKE